MNLPKRLLENHCKSTIFIPTGNKIGQMDSQSKFFTPVRGLGVAIMVGNSVEDSQHLVEGGYGDQRDAEHFKVV